MDEKAEGAKVKKLLQKEVHFCDKCGNEYPYPKVCMNCGVEMCHDCSVKLGNSYNHAVYFQGGGDGFYCHPCDKKLTTEGRSQQHNAYRQIRLLREEMEAWEKAFKVRQEAAEKALRVFTG